ncbi:MAG: phosphate ABC transporter substrate-binding/OmpA family protein [Anaeromyxobacter sp.]
MTALRRTPPRGSAAGNLLTVLLVLGLLGLGGWLLLRRSHQAAPGKPAEEASAPAQAGEGPAPIEPVTGTPTLEAAGTYEPRNDVLEVEISEYAAYGGLIVANGGLAPNPDSFFAKKYGFQVRLSLAESEAWSKVNNGKLAAAATTADTLAVLGRQFEAVVPAQISFSRGADMVVVDQGIAQVNGLAGRVLAASQFNESEFFIRYLAREAGLPVRVLRDLDARPGSNELGLVFYEDANQACDAYEAELKARGGRLAGCVGWTPRTDEIVAASKGKAKVLVSNRNLLVIADILVVNKGFSEKHPEMVKGLVHGLLEGNRQLRDEQAAHLTVVAKAFGWDEAKARDELARVHLSNLPENRAFFEGTIDAAGSFNGIFQSSVLAYGAIIRNPTDASRFQDGKALEALAKAGLFADQKIAIAPIKTQAGGALEGDPLLSRDIRFFFEPNSSALDRNAKENTDYLDAVKQFLQVSPGSVVVLRGHVDNQRVAEFRKQGGEALVRSMGLKAMELSRQRAVAVREALLARHPKLAPDRIETVGRGWEEPSGDDPDKNRRVEVQWFTLE